MTRGVVAAGHPLTADAGGEALRAGGNAVDAALAAMCASFVCEPLLTGLGAGGYMMVGTPDGEDVLLDFFVEAPGKGRTSTAHPTLTPVSVYFAEVLQVFRVGAASVGTYGVPSGICTAHARYGSLPLSELVAPAVSFARDGVAVNAQQAYIFEILHPIVESTAEARALIGATPPVEGDILVQAELGDGLELLGAEGAEPFYRGEFARRVVEHVDERGGLLTARDLAEYETIVREPIDVGYRGRRVLTNPPPSAGGILIASVLAELDREPPPPSVERLVASMEDAQGARTPEFHEGLDRPGFLEEFLAGRLGNTTHISVMDENGWACAVTVTAGSCSGIVVPGTGLHLNNMMGEADLNPSGFHLHPPGRRLPSMMAPTLIRQADGTIELALGSAGSARLRSAILQVISNVIDRGMDLGAAVEAPRLHWEEGILYVEPGLDLGGFEHEGTAIARFPTQNVFFGGCQAVQRDPATGAITAAGDPRRGGAVVSVG